MRKFAVLSATIIVLTVGLAYVWSNNPPLFFKRSEVLSIRLVELYRSSGGQELADLELLYVFTCCFIISLTLVTTGYLLRALMRKRAS